MKKNVKLMAIGMSILLVGSLAYAGATEPGTINDPLVTKSYVDQKIAEIEIPSSVQNNTYEVVFVQAGQVILGKQGSEMILRSGIAKAIDSEGGGLQDMTDGVDIEGGETIPKYHLMIIPREDGRGMLAEKDCTIMVRGGFEVK